MKAELLKGQPELGNPTPCAKGTETYTTFGTCAPIPYRCAVLEGQAAARQRSNGERHIFPTTQKANVSIWLKGDDLNPLQRAWLHSSHSSLGNLNQQGLP